MKKPTCSAPECSAERYCRGYCTKHYGRLRDRGSVEDRKVSTTAEKIESHTNKTPTCWLWTGPKQTNGYGTLQVDRIRKYAHRVAYELSYGGIPEGMRIDHICHTPLCVRPDHLRVVTIKQNTENFGGLLASNKSGYRGVHWHAESRKWNVQVTHNRQRYSGGLHSSVEDANAAAIALRNRLHTHNDLDRVAA